MATLIETINTAPGFFTSASLLFNTRNEQHYIHERTEPIAFGRKQDHEARDPTSHDLRHIK
jgi:hypothetical protein